MNTKKGNQVECDLCKRNIRKYSNIWCLAFYYLKCLCVCQECNLSIESQIWDNLKYFKLTEEKP